jgi:Protein of unknown function (DUF2752)
MHDLEKYMFPCLSKTLFGVECFGCGMQRALALVFQGNFAQAFQMYPAVYTTLLFLGVVGFHFLNKNRDYKNPLIVTGIINGVFMIGGYYFKHYL